MKTKITLGFLLCSVMSSHAVITAMATDFDIAFVNSANIPIPVGDGFISSGFFSGLSDGLLATSTIEEIDTAFQPFTSTTGVFGVSGFEGFASYSSAGERISAASPFFDQSLYFVFGNGATLTTSSELAIFKADSLKFPDDAAAASDADLPVKLGGSTPTAGTFLMGTTGGTVAILGQNISSIVMEKAVPEPSSLVLTALGALAILRRKR